MQIKILIGTIAFMLTMIILGFAALREPSRLEHFSNAELGRSIESGAQLFNANCVECHGVEGKAENCISAATGETIACKGLPLNNFGLLCGVPSPRMEAVGWEGTKFKLIESTISSGRPGGVMPTWSQTFGGPLLQNEVEHLTRYVMNWETEELCAIQPPSFPWPDNHPNAFDTFAAMTIDDVDPDAQQLYIDNSLTLSLPVNYPGDGERGEDLFLNSYGCTACHGNPTDSSVPASLGPELGDIDTIADTRIDGYSAEEYMFESILDPAAFIVPDCPSGACTDVMNKTFPASMSANPQDLADIITFLLKK